MKRYFVFTLFLALIALTACSGGTGVHGKVTDGEENKPIQGALIDLKECDTSDCEKVVASLTTGSDGRYEFPDVDSGKYMLTITWENPPDCPGIQPYDTLGRSGDFLVTYVGYGGLGGQGRHVIFAIHEFEYNEGDNVKLNLDLSCP